MSQGIMHGDLVCKLNEELLRVREELRQRDVRLEQAERLLRDTEKCEEQFFTVDFINRREGWLKEGK